MNQVLSREEVVALLQGVAEAEADPKKPGPAKTPRGPDNKLRISRRGQRSHPVGPPRYRNGGAVLAPVPKVDDNDSDRVT